MPKLTKHFIDSEIAYPSKGYLIYRDDELPGFAVRVTKKSKSYIFEKRYDGINRRITIGKCSSMTLEEARKKASIMIGEIAKGHDPITGKRINDKNDVTLAEVLDRFLDKKPLRPDTKRNYFYAVNRHSKDWLDLPITSITKDMVEELHHDLTIAPNRLGTSSHGRANNALKKLSALINFASDRYGTDDEPLIKLNPVTRLSRNRAWHRIHPRQRIVLDDKLKDWYRACCSLRHSVSRDFLIFLLFSGMRFGESRNLKWSYVDFKEKLLTVPREITKSDREHQLPLSDFLVNLLKKRRLMHPGSEWIFESTKSKYHHISQGIGIIKYVRKRSGVFFTVHDLRRTFLTMAEKLEVPVYVMKKLVNHNVSNDMTGRYLVHDIPRNRAFMNKISNAFIQLCDIKDDSNIRWLNCNFENETNSLQLQLNFLDEEKNAIEEKEEEERVDFEGELEVTDNGDHQDEGEEEFEEIDDDFLA